MTESMEHYRSEIDQGLYYGIIGITTISGLPVLFIGETMPQLIVAAIILLTIWFIHSCFYDTYYTIDYEQQLLVVKSSFLIYQTIPIQNITKIIKTNSMLSAPAASMDRIEIKQRFGSMIISPENKKGFISRLLKINPEIELDKILWNICTEPN